MNRSPLDTDSGNQSSAVHAARIYSNIFSPINTIIIFGFIVAWATMPFGVGALHAAIFGFLTQLLPVFYIVFMLKTGRIADLHVSNQNERHIPYLISIIGSLLAILVLRISSSASVLLSLSVANLALGLSLALTNLRWLISAHTASITLIAVFGSFVFSPLVGLAIAPVLALTFCVRYFF